MVQNIVLALVFGGMFTLVFGGIGFFLLSQYRKAQQEVDESQGWPEIAAEITFSEIGEHTPSRFEDQDRSTTYEPIIHYKYSVNGVDYEGKRIGFTAGGSISGTKGYAERFIKRYPVGKIVTAYYDRRKPSESVLAKNIQSQGGLIFITVISLILGLVSLVITIWVIIRQLIS